MNASVLMMKHSGRRRMRRLLRLLWQRSTLPNYTPLPAV